MPDSLQDMLDIAVAAANQSSIILMERFGNIQQIVSKDSVKKEFVTDVDLQVEGEIITIIRDEFPDHCILSEERGDLIIDSDYKWIIDPLDGTHNYAHKMPLFGTSIALEHKGQVIIGIVTAPYFKHTYKAVRGKGAFLNDEKINVSKRDLGNALMIFDTKLRFDDGPMLKTLGKLVHKAHIVRMYGCATWDLSMIAIGNADMSVDFTAKPWDLAAGALIVEESGGKVTDLRGNDWNAYSKGFVASNGVMHAEILEIISEFL
ncbi:inositol monophosphatase [Candidatus Poribacteria bacterium]|nr:inositol monophosphatase [Candidatus Poribacteria bacterium]